MTSATAPQPPSPAPLREPPPIPYELRIGVTGHCEIERPAELAEVVKHAVERQIVAVLEGASARPRGAHGSPPRRFAGLFRALTLLLAPATWVLFGALRLVGAAVAALARSLGREGVGRLQWPVVPHAPVDPPDERTTPLELTVVTSLAPGSDQIVAEAVCGCVARPERRNRILEAVLPMPANEYEGRLASEAAREKFRALLARDRGEPTVVCPDFPKGRDGEPVDDGEAYRAAGREVVEQSEVLLAVWDPDRDAKPGGTRDAIEHALEHARIVLWIDPRDLARGARWLKELPKRGESGLVCADPPQRAKELSPHFHRLAAYNRDGAWDPAAFERILGEERRRLARAAGLPEDGSAASERAPDEIPEKVLEIVSESLLGHFARADQLAGRYHALRNFVTAFLPTVSALAVTLMAFQILFWPELYVLAALEIALLGVGYLSYQLSERETWHEKWLYDRHLAERLRCLLYTFALPTSGGGVHLLPFYRPTNEWFMSTLSRVAGRLRRDLQPVWEPERHAAAIARHVRTGWIEHEAAYHAAVRDRTERSERGARVFTVLALVTILGVATAHALGVGHHAAEGTPVLGRIDLWVAFFTIAIPAWAAAYYAVEVLDDAPHLQERADRMAERLEGLARSLEQVDDLEKIDAIVEEARRITELESHAHAASLRGRVMRFHG